MNFRNYCIGAFISAFLIATTAIADADDTCGFGVTRSANETAKEELLNPPLELETSKVTSSGTYYKIDSKNCVYYERPKVYSFLTNVPFDIVDWLKDSFQKKNTLVITGLYTACWFCSGFR